MCGRYMWLAYGEGKVYCFKFLACHFSRISNGRQYVRIGVRLSRIY